jgi:hypothetical protein
MNPQQLYPTTSPEPMARVTRTTNRLGQIGILAPGPARASWAPGHAAAARRRLAEIAAEY